MALTQEQILEARKQAGIPEQGYVQASGSALDTRTAGLQDIWDEYDRNNAPLISKAASKVKDIVTTRGNEAANVQVSKQSVSSKILQTAGKGAAAVGDIALAGAGALIPDKIKQGAKSVAASASKNAQLNPQFEGAKKLLGAVASPVSEWAAAHPEAAANLGAIVDLASLIPGAKGASLASDAAKTSAKNAAKAVIPTVESKAAKTLEKTTAALQPVTAGKKGIKAYQEIATKDRDVTTANLFRDQKLSPDVQTRNVAHRLNGAGVVLKGSPIEDLKTLGKSLKSTEDDLQKALADADPEMHYLADKPKLFKELNKVKTDVPHEYAAIRDSKSVYNGVVDFATRMLKKSPDTPKGLREARVTFDMQARREFPSAYREGGFIDTKTPAGRAIKEVRDTINEHLYSTAPQGSAAKELVLREADLFKAIESIAAKAFKDEGKDKLDKLREMFKNHPVIGSILSGTGAITSIYGTAKLAGF